MTFFLEIRKQLLKRFNPNSPSACPTKGSAETFINIKTIHLMSTIIA